MSGRSSLGSRIAGVLFRHAEVIMPAHRRDWFRAMHAELEHIEQHHVLRWSIGCVIACYIERLKIMNCQNFAISKWLLAVEALVCFLPVTMLWIFTILNLSIVIERHLMAASMLPLIIAPVNLWFALRFVMTRGALRYRVHMFSAVLFALYALLQVTAVQDSERMSLAWFQFDWGLTIMFFIFPALCCWHLAFLADDRPVARNHVAV